MNSKLAEAASAIKSCLRNKRVCGGRDLNSGTPTGQDPKSCAFDHLATPANFWKFDHHKPCFTWLSVIGRSFLDLRVRKLLDRNSVLPVKWFLQ